MPEDQAKEPGERVGATLRGYYCWAFSQVRYIQGTDADAFTYIIGRWLDTDRTEALNEFKISRDEYRAWLAKKQQGGEH